MRNLYPTAIVYCRTLALFAMLATGTARAENLYDIYQLAQKNDPAFQAAQYDYEAEQQKIPIARSTLLPSLDATAARVRSRDELDAPGQPFIVQGSNTYYSTEYGVAFTQPLFDRGKYMGYKQAQSQVSLAGYRFDIARIDLALRTAVRYFAVLAAQDSLEVAQAERKANERQLELANERLSVGLGTKTDQYDAEARFRVAESQEIAARNTLDDAQRALAEIIGQLPGTLAKITEEPVLGIPQPEDPEHWVKQALSGNLELSVSRQAEDVALREIKLRESGHYPSLDFVVNHSHDDAEGSISGPGSVRTSTDALLQLKVPLLAGGGVLALTKEARLRYESAQRQTERTRRNVERNARSSFLGIVTSLRQVAALKRAVIAGESALEAKQEGFEAGLNTNIDVLDAQRDLYRAQRDYLRARYDYILNWLRLKQVLGSLTEEDLQRTSTWLK